MTCLPTAREGAVLWPPFFAVEFDKLSNTAYTPDMLKYIREIWWQRVDYWSYRVATARTNLDAAQAFQRTPRVRSVLSYADRFLEARQMRYGVQFMIADEVLEDAGNRDLITAAFGDASGRGSELSAAEQVALLHSLVINPTRPSTQIDTATESGELPDLTRLIADMVRFSDPNTLRRAARTLHGHADHRQQRYDGSGKPYVRIQSDPVPLEPETEPRRGRRIELPLRAGTLSGESAD